MTERVKTSKGKYPAVCCGSHHKAAGNVRLPNGSVVYVDGKGIYQTGIEHGTGLYYPNHADASMIEFMGNLSFEKDKSGPEISKYKLVRIIVYD